MRTWTIVLLALALAACGGPFADAKKAAASLLKDPGSAQFREVQQGGRLVCGEINGKNTYGAYSGFTRFVYDGLRAEIEPMNGRLGDPSADEIAAVEAKTAFLRRYNTCLSAARESRNR